MGLLTPQGEIVNDNHHTTTNKQHSPSTGQHGPLSDDLGGNSCGLGHLDLYESKNEGCQSEENEEENYSPVAPGVSRATPLKGQDEADHGWHKEECSERV